MDIGNDESFNGSRRKGKYKAVLVKGLPVGFGFGDLNKDLSESDLKMMSQNSTVSNLSDKFHSYQTQATSFRKKDDYEQPEPNCISCVIT